MNTRFLSLSIAGSALAIAAICLPTSGRASAAPPRVDAAGCRSIYAEMCEACPGRRAYFCQLDLMGIYTSCTPISYDCTGGSCPTTHVAAGPGCPVPP